jgi:hypothetical protein
MVVRLIALWGVSFFWDQGAMQGNPLTSSSILDIGRRSGHYSWDVPDLIHCTWIVSLFSILFTYGKSSRYLIFILLYWYLIEDRTRSNKNLFYKTRCTWLRPVVVKNKSTWFTWLRHAIVYFSFKILDLVESYICVLWGFSLVFILLLCSRDFIFLI